MRIGIILVLLLQLVFGHSQTTLLKASFDDGTADDDIFGFDGINNGANRTCGVKTNAFNFDGNSSVLFPPEVTAYLGTAFTISFYMQPNNDEDAVISVMSSRSNCDRDSSFAISYFPPTRQLTVEFAENRIDFLRLAAPLDENKCWQYIVITYSLAELSLYINNELRDRVENISRPIIIDSTATFNISGSPCIGDMSLPYIGKIDELCIIDKALDEREVLGAYLMPDEILTRDTSIFRGNSVAVITGGTCSDDFIWSPGVGVNSPNDAEPIFTPTETTTYFWNVNYDNCSTQDSFTITVIDPDDIDCTKISLPTAFTPNGDGLNDFYGISNPIIVENLNSFEIFDKWGAKMFSTSDKTTKWDGFYNGSIPNTNSFVYKVSYTCKGDGAFKMGSFTILR